MGDDFPRDVVELMSYCEPAHPGQAVRAVPGEGLDVPVWILGSSLLGAQVAAMLGLPFAFASHRAPTHMAQAVARYREWFEPSVQLTEPHVMLALNVFAADTDAEGGRLFTSLQQAFVNLRRGTPGLLAPPDESLPDRLAPFERQMLDEVLSCTVAGSPETVRRGLQRFVARTGADEVIVTSQGFDHQARLRSFEIAAEVAGLSRAQRGEAVPSGGDPATGAFAPLRP